MLEASSFDFRNRHPQDLLIKFLKYYKVQQNSQLALTAYRISLDLYRTFAPLKQTTPTLAFACLELAGRLLNSHSENLIPSHDYLAWNVTRAEVMGTLLLPYPSSTSNISCPHRNPPRPPRALHTLPQQHYSRSLHAPRSLPRSPDPAESRDVSQKPPPLYRMARPHIQTDPERSPHKICQRDLLIQALTERITSRPSISHGSQQPACELERGQHTRRAGRRTWPRWYNPFHAEPREGARGKCRRGRVLLVRGR